MRRNDHDGRRQRCGRRGVVALLAAVAGVGVVCAGPAVLGHDLPAPRSGASAPVAAANTATPDAALVQAAPHVGRLGATHYPTAAAATAALLPLLLLASRRQLIPIAVSRHQLLCGAPLQRGPPTFRAR